MTSVRLMEQNTCLDKVKTGHRLRHTVSIKTLQVWLLDRHTSIQDQLQRRSQQLQGSRGSCAAGADHPKHSLDNLQHAAGPGVAPPQPGSCTPSAISHCLHDRQTTAEARGLWAAGSVSSCNASADCLKHSFGDLQHTVQARAGSSHLWQTSWSTALMMRGRLYMRQLLKQY